jgi:uncharacterized protein
MSSDYGAAVSAMAEAAMPLDQLEQWLQARADRRPAATSIPMLDGYVTAIVAGPVSMNPPDWINPLLAVDADAFHHGGTPEVAAISAVTLRHNVISNTLSTAPERLQPMFRRKPGGGVDVRSWCQGFYAAMKLRLPAWLPLLDVDDSHLGLLLPILFFCVDDRGRPIVPTSDGATVKRLRRGVHADIPVMVDAIRRYWMRTRFRDQVFAPRPIHTASSVQPSSENSPARNGASPTEKNSSS